jgi:hypothetical protein
MSIQPLSTLLLDTVAWDLVLDSNANIALASPPYAVAQDVASACRLFQGELWYDTTQGVPYWQQLLGQNPTTSQIAAAFNAAALTVPSVVTSNTVITSIQDGKVSGQVQFSTSDGTSTTVNFL